MSIYNQTPQTQIGLEIDITTPGVLMPCPTSLTPDVERRLRDAVPPIINAHDVYGSWNYDDGPDPAICPVCNSWSAALHDDGTCENPQCATNSAAD